MFFVGLGSLLVSVGLPHLPALSSAMPLLALGVLPVRCLHRGAVLQRVYARRVFKGYGVAKWGCAIDLICNIFVQDWSRR